MCQCNQSESTMSRRVSKCVGLHGMASEWKTWKTHTETRRVENFGRIQPFVPTPTALCARMHTLCEPFHPAEPPKGFPAFDNSDPEALVETKLVHFKLNAPEHSTRRIERRTSRPWSAPKRARSTFRPACPNARRACFMHWIFLLALAAGSDHSGGHVLCCHKLGIFLSKQAAFSAARPSF